VNEILIFIPTYNEAENAERLCRELSALSIGADILFCDDNSLDGTGEIVSRLVEENEQVYAIHRIGKLGIGSAHQAGIRYAYSHNYKTLVTMDCDFTHLPLDVLRLLKVAHNSARPVAIASRYMENNSLPGWNIMRRSLTYFGHLLTTRLLGLPHDATGALRVYKLDQVPREIFDLVTACGYSFFFESIFVLHRNHLAIEEMPIALPARSYGSSKMCLRETWRSGFRLLHLWYASLRHPKGFLLSSPANSILPRESALETSIGSRTVQPLNLSETL
jgi:dolichol-phosphate mannosyltransferase